MSPKFLARKVIKKTFYNDEKSVNRLLRQYTYFYNLKHNDRAMIKMAEQLVLENIDEIIRNYKNLEFLLALYLYHYQSRARLLFILMTKMELKK